MNRHHFYGDPARFRAVADYIADRYGRRVRYVADVAGGQGMLARILRKQYHYAAEVVDPRGRTLVGVPHRACAFAPPEADYYDLIVGLHPDQATRAVAAAALVRPTMLVPCCNFWSAERLGQEALLRAIEDYYDAHAVVHERVTFQFAGPKNVGLVSEPPAHLHEGTDR